MLMESESESLEANVDAGVDADIDAGIEEVDAGADLGADSVSDCKSQSIMINLRVWLKIPDAEAATVKNTLVRRLGFGNVLEDVKKERLFSIEVDSGDPEELARSFAKELVNEN